MHFQDNLLPYINCKKMDITTVHFINDFFQGVKKRD